MTINNKPHKKIDNKIIKNINNIKTRKNSEIIPLNIERTNGKIIENEENTINNIKPKKELQKKAVKKIVSREKKTDNTNKKPYAIKTKLKEKSIKSPSKSGWWNKNINTK